MTIDKEVIDIVNNFCKYAQRRCYKNNIDVDDVRQTLYTKLVNANYNKNKSKLNTYIATIGNNVIGELTHKEKNKYINISRKTFIKKFQENEKFIEENGFSNLYSNIPRFVSDKNLSLRPSGTNNDDQIKEIMENLSNSEKTIINSILNSPSEIEAAASLNISYFDFRNQKKEIISKLRKIYLDE